MAIGVVDHEVVDLVGEHLGGRSLECCFSIDAVGRPAHQLLHGSIVWPVVGEIRGRDDANDSVRFDDRKGVKAHRRQKISRSPGVVSDMDRDRTARHEIGDNDWLLNTVRGAVAHVLIEH